MKKDIDPRSEPLKFLYSYKVVNSIRTYIRECSNIYRYVNNVLLIESSKICILPLLSLILPDFKTKKFIQNCDINIYSNGIKLCDTSYSWSNIEEYKILDVDNYLNKFAKEEYKKLKDIINGDFDLKWKDLGFSRKLDYLEYKKECKQLYEELHSRLKGILALSCLDNV
jgi:hypothetical protein